LLAAGGSFLPLLKLERLILLLLKITSLLDLPRRIKYGTTILRRLYIKLQGFTPLALLLLLILES
jgi:hypothetical protein